MLTKILLLTLASQGMGAYHYAENPVPDPSQSHDNDECVDVSRYGDVEYNTTTENVCSYKVERSCQPRSERVCVNIPATECTMEAGVNCNTDKFGQTVRCDTTEKIPFTPKSCFENGFQILQEIKKKPECKNVTKAVCDSKWEIDATGEKVWAGNQNCREKTWEDCRLVDKVVQEEVPVLTCQDEAAESYLALVIQEEEVTTIQTQCSASGGALCRVLESTECTQVEWTECEERVIADCRPVTTRVPYQEYEHLLRCKVQH